MSAYMITQAIVSDAEAMERYRAAVRPLLAANGAKPIAIAHQVEVLEGNDPRGRLAVFEFPSVQAIHQFWESPEYAAVKELRAGAAEFDIWIAPGMSS